MLRASVSPGTLGILPERIEPGQPQQNGRHERFHRTLKEQTATPPKASIPDQQRAFDLFRADYNDRRPHEALGQTPPATHYEASLRPFPDHPRALEYAEELDVRRVVSNGNFSWKGAHLHIGKILSGQPVGLNQTDEDEWEVFYGPITTSSGSASITAGISTKVSGEIAVGVFAIGARVRRARVRWGRVRASHSAPFESRHLHHTSFGR
jgi:hypothetical protein